MLTILTVSLIPLLLSALWLYTSTTSHPPPPSLQNTTIHLLIAHPDDEAMFFAPTLLALTSPRLNNTLSVLCLSTGNAENLGAIREKELVASCEILGVDRRRVHSFDHPELQDSMQKTWPPSEISEILAEHKPSVIITFDESGVSSHLNHVSLLRGAEEYVSANDAGRTRLFTLTSVPIWRKYAFFLDAFFVRLGGRGGEGEEKGKRVVFVSSWDGYVKARSAMVNAHVSQMRWFRWGWIGLSRYMVVNDLVERG
ncbi:LmbE-like protein [Choiromyces venosus 120613-1]|uniref:N-acetylglucosaminylphosphatidylinositol deacetylase n=1 Tax=Choiromyces venosus 120613-1 TaxID=1336337 RepID=A0A3N4J3J5_9PEZI|nr:LmbE-like protein [Choiromyces venosus 120613-1]